MMGMCFDSTISLNNILFENWSTSSTQGVVLASFLSCLFTVLFEGLKTLRSYVVLLRQCNPYADKERIASREIQTNDSEADLLSVTMSLSSKIKLKQWRERMFTVESILNLVSFVYGYLLMLLVMTYSVWLVLAVLIGTGVGYFFFHPVNEHLRFKLTLKHKPYETQDCCSSQNDYSLSSQPQHGVRTKLIQAPVRKYLATKHKFTPHIKNMEN